MAKGRDTHVVPHDGTGQWNQPEEGGRQSTGRRKRPSVRARPQAGRRRQPALV